MAQDDVRAFIDDLQEILEIEKLLLQAARDADALIAAQAIGQYMQLVAPTTAPNRTDKLRIQSGRLSRAVKGGIDRESTTTISFDGKILTYRRDINVEYAAIHEFGGEIVVPITARMRRFFWARFKATGEDKWKWMALTKKREFRITMPARPYLSPAMDDMSPTITVMIQKRFDKFVETRLKA